MGLCAGRGWASQRVTQHPGETSLYVFSMTLLCFLGYLSCLLLFLLLLLSSAFPFVLFPGVVRALRDGPADPPTRQYLCSSAAPPSSPLQPEPVAALLLPSLLAHLRSTTMTPCLFSTVDGTQWSRVDHLP